MQARRAVTLIELIVVLGIIIILMSLYLPVLANARRKAAKYYCESQIGQIAAAVGMYCRESERAMPRSWLPSVDRRSVFLPVILGPFLGGETKVFRCPADTAGFTDRPPPNGGRSFIETEQSSYSYMPANGVAEYEPFHRARPP